jgi:hypothetical protein
MASLPLSPFRPPPDTGLISRNAGSPAEMQGVIMLLVGLLFFVLVALASAFGLTADSRDSADWKPTVDGFGAGRTY